MKFVFCVSLVLAVLGSALGQSSGNQKVYLEMLAQLRKAQVRDEMELKLINSIQRLCPEKEVEDIEGLVDRLKTCGETEIDLESQTVCSVMKTTVPKCMAPFSSFMESCLPERSRDIPNHVLKILKSTSEYVCKSDGEHLLELFNPCAAASSYNFRKCVRRVRSKLQQYERELPSASEFCSALKSLQPCYTNFIESSCGNPITKDSYLGLFDAVFKPCSSYHENEIESVESVENFRK